MNLLQNRLFQTVPLFLILVFAITSCNNPDNRVIPVKNMQEDLSVLWSSIIEIHPAYGLYTPKDRLLQLYKRTASLLNKPMSENEFIAAIHPFISALKCGH